MILIVLLLFYSMATSRDIICYVKDINNYVNLHGYVTLDKEAGKAIVLYNLDYTVFGEYPSIVETAKSINCSEKTISRALKTEKKILKRRFIVKYK